HYRAQFEKAAMLLFRAKPHDAFHARAVVPTAIEDDDFSGGGEMLDVALHVHLSFLSVRRSGKRHHAEDARADALRDGLDRAALSCPIAALHHQDDALPLGFHPILELAEFHLKLA